MNEILQNCLAIAASLCMNGHATIEVDSGSTWQGAKITLGDLRVISTTRTDSFAYPDRRRMNRLCNSGGSCIYYHKHCLENSGGGNCVVYFNEPGDHFNRSVRLSATSLAAIEIGSSSLSLITSSGNDLIKLSELVIRACDAVPPYCRPKDDPSCK